MLLFTRNKHVKKWYYAHIKKIRVRFLLSVLIILVLAVSAYDFWPVFNKQPGLEHFFKGSFNMTPDEIRALYDIEPESFRYPGQYFLCFEQIVMGRPTLIVYSFQKHGLIFKNFRLITVDCSMDFKGLSISQVQRLAEDAFEHAAIISNASRYEYFGYVRPHSEISKEHLEEFRWQFFGSSTGEHKVISVTGSTGYQYHKLSLLFSQTPIIYHHEFEWIVKKKTEHGEFDYAKWENVYP